MNTVNFCLFVVAITRAYNVDGSCSGCTHFKTQFHDDAIPNKALTNHVFKSFTHITTKVLCFGACRDDCRCMSYNFMDKPSVDGTPICELNSADYKTDSQALKSRPGFTYYDIHLVFSNSAQCAKQSCSTKCCQSNPCQNGGECRAVCGQKKRLQCTCTAGFTGELCTIKANKTCRDHWKYNRLATAGKYDIQNDNGKTFTVFCDFRRKIVWTLVMSYKLANNDQFKTHPLYKDHPVAENLPNWAAYRLSKARMLSIQSQSSLWRATCNYNTDGLVTTDSVRSSFENVDPITFKEGGCKMMEFVNIRDKGCKMCTIWCRQSDNGIFGIANWYGEFGINPKSAKCSFVNPAQVVEGENSFGRYKKINRRHRCASRQASTTQYWFGSPLP